MNRCFSLIPLVLFAACASTPPQPQPIIQTKLITPDIAPSLLECGVSPRAPSHAALQSDVARYVVSLWVWGSECQSHLQAVQQSLTDISSSNNQKGS